MRRCLWILTLLCLLSACSTTLHTEVRIKHAWPAKMTDKTWTLAGGEPPQDAEHQVYAQALQGLRQELRALGFVEASVAADANLLVSLQLASEVQPVYHLENVWFAPHGRLRYPWHWRTPGVRAMYWGPHFGPRVGPYWGPRLMPGWWHWAGTHLDPFWTGGPLYVYRESPFPWFQRELKIVISAQQKASESSQTKPPVWFEALARNASRSENLELILPFMLRSALQGFPGKDGSVVLHELRLEP